MTESATPRPGTIAGRLRVAVDRSLCETHGRCAFLAPGVFQLDAEHNLAYDEMPDSSMREDLEEAVEACPTQAIAIHFEAKRSI